MVPRFGRSVLRHLLLKSLVLAEFEAIGIALCLDMLVILE